MIFDIPIGALTPPQTVTITDEVPIVTAGGVSMVFTDSGGATLFTDAAPALDTTNPLAVKVTHTWLPGQTDNPGTYGVQVFVAGLAYPASGPLAWTVGQGARAGYCTLAQARGAGATGDDAAVTAAILSASDEIDRFTRDVFAPVQMTLVAQVTADGTALLPRRVRQVQRVTAVGSATVLPSSGYLVLSSATPGQVDALVFGGLGLSDPLIAGAEPWNGGYRNLVSGALGATGQVQVSGSFGWDAPPAKVVSAAAQLAAAFTSSGAVDLQTDSPESVPLDVDEDGNVVTITAGAVTTEVRPGRTTGYDAVDAMLLPYCRDLVRLA